MSNTTIKGVNNTMKNKINSTPIQDESGILCFSLENHKYFLNVNVEDERERVKREVNSHSKHLYDWFKEYTGNKHWVLYDTEMYLVKYDSTGQWRYLNYREENASTQMDGALAQNSHIIGNSAGTLNAFPTIPINATSCYSMFYGCKNLWTLDLSSFSTENIKNFSYMFSGCENLYHIDVSNGWNTDAAITADNVFEDCYRLPHYRDGRIGLEMCCSVNEGGYFHYVGEEDDYE